MHKTADNSSLVLDNVCERVTEIENKLMKRADLNQQI